MIEIKLVKHSEQKEQLIDLFRLSFGRNMTERLWDWKYINNPLVPPQPDVIVAAENGKIAGARPFLLAEMWIDNSKRVVAQHCDTMVHPDFRNRGIFNLMGKYSIQYLKDNNYALSYGFPNLLSRRGFLNQGYRVVAPIENIFRPVNTQKLISQRVNNRFAGNVLGFFYDKLLNPRISSIEDQKSGFVVEVADRFQSEMSAIDDWKISSKIDMVRTEKNLKWRFDAHPEHKYRYILVKKDQKLEGYAVVSVRTQSNGQKHGMIVDYLVRNNDSACFLTLIKRSITELAKSNCDMIVMWGCSEPNFRIETIKHLGLKSSFKYPYSKFFGYDYMDGLLIDERLAGRIDVYNKDNWRLTNAFPDFT